MEPKSHKSESEKSSAIMQKSSNTDIEETESSDEIKKTNNAVKETICLNIGKHQINFSLSKLAVIGVLTVAVVTTFFLITKGSDFCFLSTCYDFPAKNPIAYSFWSFAAGLGMYGILTVMGLSLPVAALGALGIWFIMQISLN